MAEGKNRENRDGLEGGGGKVEVWRWLKRKTERAEKDRKVRTKHD